MLCDSCFNDKFLSDQIKELSSGSVSQCTYCNSTNVRVLDETAMTDTVSSILSLYSPSVTEEAKELHYFLKKDWSLLKNVDDANCRILLDKIFPEQNPSNLRFVSKQAPNKKSNLWDEFQLELKHKNRFFPVNKIEVEDLKNLFSFLILKDNPSSFFRARVCEDKTKYPIDRMGKPPEKWVRNGRANPVGISYLYTASAMDTAISEVRPHVGDYVTIAQFNSNRPLVLLDLRDPRETISPFAIEEEELLDLLNELEYLCKLGEQLSKAILPKEADLEYLGSQYLCEMIKHFNYDGVVYRSSMGHGFNIALFDDSKLQPQGDTQIYKVNTVNYSSIEIISPE